MTGDDPPYFWWTEVSYLAGGRGRVLLSLGGRDHVVDVQKGLHRFFLAGQGSVTPVTLRSDPSQPTRDRYGRMLRYVAGVHGGDVALQLLEHGAGELYRSDPPLERAEDYAEAAARAEETGAGRWGACT